MNLSLPELILNSSNSEHVQRVFGWQNDALMALPSRKTTLPDFGEFFLAFNVHPGDPELRWSIHIQLSNEYP